MKATFKPVYEITPAIANYLLRIEAAKEHVNYLPLTPVVLASLRQTARLYTTHYSTMIEGNALSVAQIKEVIEHKGHFPGRERDEREVRGYYAALTRVEQWAHEDAAVTTKVIQQLHALVMAGGRSRAEPTPYRDGQNVIRDGATGALMYMPPEAKDVPHLMREFVHWIDDNQGEIPCALVAAIAHYQFATIHPYYDGNGRTARLLTTLVLHQGGYDAKGLYSLEEYYARNLPAYYRAISVGSSHNYYMGRAEADITGWIEYFLEGMAIAFEHVIKHMRHAEIKGLADHSTLIKNLDPRQRRVLELFQSFNTVTAQQVGDLFGFKQRTGAQLCHDWVQEGFLEVENPANKNRSYKLAEKYAPLIMQTEKL
jgi:Fic family protein